LICNATVSVNPLEPCVPHPINDTGSKSSGNPIHNTRTLQSLHRLTSTALHITINQMTKKLPNGTFPSQNHMIINTWIPIVNTGQHGGTAVKWALNVKVVWWWPIRQKYAGNAIQCIDGTFTQMKIKIIRERSDFWTNLNTLVENLGTHIHTYNFHQVCSTNFYLLYYPSSTHERALSQYIFLSSPAELAWPCVIK
jgi:hypothetical protein